MTAPATVPSMSALTLRTIERRFLWVALVLNAVLWIFVLLQARPQSEPIILHYTLYFGVDRVGEWYRAYLLPTAGTVVIAVNHLVARVYRGQDPLVGSLLAGFSLAVLGILWLAALTMVR